MAFLAGIPHFSIKKTRLLAILLSISSNILILAGTACDRSLLQGLKLFLEDSLGVKVDLVTRAALRPRLRSRIEAEAKRVA